MIKMRLTYCLGPTFLLHLWVCVHACFGQPPADPDELKNRVEQLAKQLDADKEAERDAAEAELNKIGPEALPFLPPISEQISEEHRMRLERVREFCFEADRKTLLEPTRITLSGEVSAHDALESIAAQSRNRLETGNALRVDSLIQVEFDNLLYWEAIDEILDKIGMTIPPNDGSDFLLVPREPAFPQRAAMATYSGAFRIEPIAISKGMRTYEPDESSCSVELWVSWEPRLKPVLLQFDFQTLEIQCDNGEVLQPKPEQGSDFLPSGSQLVAMLEFERPTRAAREIRSLKGRFECSLPGTSVALSFSDLSKSNNERLSLGQFTVTLEKTRKNQDIYEVLIGVEGQKEISADSLQGWTSLVDVSLKDSQGNRIEHAGWSTTRITDTGIGLSFLFEVEKDLEGHQLQIVAPQSILQQSVEFALENIPLP